MQILPNKDISKRLFVDKLIGGDPKGKCKASNPASSSLTSPTKKTREAQGNKNSDDPFAMEEDLTWLNCMERSVLSPDITYSNRLWLLIWQTWTISSRPYVQWLITIPPFLNLLTSLLDRRWPLISIACTCFFWWLLWPWLKLLFIALCMYKINPR